MKAYTRADRVGVEIKKILCDVLIKEIKDPRVQSATITEVKMANDLKTAKIYFCIYSNNSKNSNINSLENNVVKALKGFKSASGYIKRFIAKELNLRYVPEISFFYDNSFISPLLYFTR